MKVALLVSVASSLRFSKVDVKALSVVAVVVKELEKDGNIGAGKLLTFTVFILELGEGEDFD